jgi:HK97 family phage major capsid protein
MEMKDIQAALEQSNTEIKQVIAKCREEVKTFGDATAETKEAMAKLQKQVDALDEKRQQIESAPKTKTIGDHLNESEDIKKLIRDGKGHAVMTIPWDLIRQQKTVLTSDNVGSTPRQTTGVLAIERTPGIVPEARRPLLLRQLLSSRTTDMAVIDFVKVANALADAQVQSPEGGVKHENAITFSTVSERLKTVATTLPVTKQLLKYVSELESFLRTGLAYYVEKETEDQLVNGNGAGQTLHGLIPQATAFNTSLLPPAASGWTALDIIGRAASQVAIADEIPPTFVVLNPDDWWEIRMTKDKDGRYILADPWSNSVPNLFGMTPVATNAIAAGDFLIGSGSPEATELRIGSEITVEISTEHSDFFVRNQVMIRAEQMLALVTYRPASFITGAMTTSP